MALAFPAAAAAVRQRENRGDFAVVVHRKSSAAVAAAWSAAADSTGLPVVPLRDPRPDRRLGAAVGLLVPVLNHLGRSDHASFWRLSVPALMITDSANFRNRHYHRPSDQPDTVDYARMAAVTAATAATTLVWSRLTGAEPI